MSPALTLAGVRHMFPTLFDSSSRHLRRYRVRSAKLRGDQALSPEGLNLVQANKLDAQQPVAHFHIHILPRNRGDELKLNWGAKPGDPQTIAAIAEKIRANL